MFKRSAGYAGFWLIDRWSREFGFGKSRSLGVFFGRVGSVITEFFRIF